MDYILDLPEGVDIGEHINKSMKGIEDEYPVLLGIPKDYNLFEKDLLHRLLRVFNDETIDNIKGDVFGIIYEYFLNNLQ